MTSLIIVLVYVAITCVIGFMLTKRSKNTGELFVAKDQLSTLLLVILLFGEIIAASSTTGSAQGGYTQGLSAIWIFAGKGLGAILFAIVMAKFFTRAGKAGAMSIPEAFKWRFDAKTRMVVTIIILIPLVILCSTQCKACASLIAPMIGTDVTATAVVIGLLFGALSFTGLKGIADMNILHTLVIFIGIAVVSVVCINSIGGIEVLAERIPAEYTNLMYPSTSKIAGDFITAALAFMVAVTPTNACYSSDNIKRNRIALCSAGVLSTVYSIFPVLIGLCGFVALPGINANTILYTMPASISPVFGLITSIAVLAVVMSTAPFLFLSAATIFVRDVAMVAKPNMNQHQEMRLAYVFLIVVTVFAIFFSIYTDTIFGQIIGAAHIKATAAIVLITGLFWKRLTNNAAFVALLTSGFLAVVSYFSGSVFGLHIEAFWPTLAVSVLSMILVTLIDRKNQFKSFEHYKQACEELDRADESAEDMKVVEEA